MVIFNLSYVRRAVHFFQEMVVRPITNTDQNRKIFVSSAMSFGFLATTYDTIKPYFKNGFSKQVSGQQNEEQVNKTAAYFLSKERENSTNKQINQKDKDNLAKNETSEPLRILPPNESLQEAVKQYEHAANLGDRDAMNSLGDMYFAGECLEQNKVEAFKWYKKAAKKGQIEAMLKVYDMHSKGDSVGITDEKAFKLYEEAAFLKRDVATLFDVTIIKLKRDVQLCLASIMRGDDAL